MTKKINIGFILNTLQHGGVERYVLDLYKNIDSSVFEPFLYCLRQLESPMEKEIQAAKINVRFIPRNIGKDFRIYKKLADVLKKDEIDIVHSNNWGTFLEASLASRFTRAKHIHVQHGLEFNEQERHGFLKYSLIKLSRRMLSNYTAQFASVSQVGKHYLEREWHVDSKKILVIHNGIDEHKFSANEQKRSDYRRELGLSEDQFVIGAVGRFHPVKNFPLLIEAIAKLKAIAPNVRLFLIGGSTNSPLYPKLKALSRSLHLEDSVTFLFKRNDISDILNAFDTFVLPSKSEGLSLSILEALATGLPVVASDVGGNPELIDDGENGFLFENGNAQDLSDNIYKIISNPAKSSQISINAREGVLRRFTHRLMIDKYNDIYSGLAGTR